MKSLLVLSASALLLPAVLLPGAITANAAPVAPRVTAATAPTGTVIPSTHCTSFPANNYWNTDIRKLKIDKHSKQWLSHMQVGSRHLHADFGPSYGAQPVPYGIPVTIVNGAPKVKVQFAYASESNRVGYPFNSKTKIEGGPKADGDRHAIVVDAKTCTLYETWNTRATSKGWTAGSGAVWSLRSNALRPAGWTSADAAGLPILPGLLQYNEVKSGKVKHAIRFTTNITNRAFIWPARHQAGSVSNAAYPPMGARFRLNSSFSLKGYSRDAQVVLTAMKVYGLVLADNGSPWYFQGTSDSRWTGALVQQLGRVPASAFQAVDTAPLRISANSAQAR